MRMQLTYVALVFEFMLSMQRCSAPSDMWFQFEYQLTSHFSELPHRTLVVLLHDHSCLGVADVLSATT